MRLKFLGTCCAVFLLNSLIPSPVQAAYVFRNGKFVEQSKAATMSAEGHYNAGLNALQCQQWQKAANQFYIITCTFPNSTYAQDAYFHMGVAYFNLQEFDFSNEAFSAYLKLHGNPLFFQQVIEYKLAIANKFRSGAKKRFFGLKQLPKWAPGESMALEIYDEVIAAMPCHDLAAVALFEKGCLSLEYRNFSDSVESFQLLIRRFPKHELACESYLKIGTVYLIQSRIEFQNPDLLALAQINLRKFQLDFPRDERACQLEQDAQAMKEIYAQGLYDVGMVYERMRKPGASEFYYKSAINQFPDTVVAQLCEQRLGHLRKVCLEHGRMIRNMERSRSVEKKSGILCKKPKPILPLDVCLEIAPQNSEAEG